MTAPAMPKFATTHDINCTSNLTELWCSKKDYDALRAYAEGLAAAMQEFVDRVGSRRYSSYYTYRKFKTLLDSAAKDKP